MKKILILADGAVAWEFVARVTDSFSDTNLYDIVYYDDSFQPKTDAIHCRFYKFDPTSFKKLEAIFSKNYILAYIIMEKKEDIKSSYENLRVLSKDLPINLLDYGEFEAKEDDEYLSITNLNELLANRMMALLPNIPISAQHVGLGLGEIIEVQVPFGSSYAYRHISNIEQKKWKIGAVYRNNELVLPAPSLMIRPGDNLLLIGQPTILKSVYKAIKIESGQFPAPYGRNIYLILDSKKSREKEALREIETALLMHRRIKNKMLFIKVINPDSFEILEKLREIDMQGVIVDIAYTPFDIEKDLIVELNRLNVGLIMISTEFFKKKEHRELLYKSKKAVFKMGENSIKDLKTSLLMLSNNPMLENISSAIFDLSTQLSLAMTLYMAEGDEIEESIKEHYENLAEIHSKKLEFKTIKNNVILSLKKESGVLLFLPFDSTLVHRGVLDLFDIKHIERFYPMLYSHSQIFVPVL